MVDVTHATDYPGIDKRQHGDYRLGGGPVLSRGASVSEVVFELLAAAAEAEEIPYTIEAASRDTHTDAEAIFNAHRGRGHGAGLGAQPLHAQPQRDGRARGPRPHRPPARRVRPPARPRHRLRAALNAARILQYDPPNAAHLSRSCWPWRAAPVALAAQFGDPAATRCSPAPPPITAIDDIRFLSDDRLGRAG